MAADAFALGFSAVGAFAGPRPGYVFQMGALGLGYYHDKSAGGDAAWARAQAQAEQVDLDDKVEGPDMIEQMSVPAAVFGSAAVGAGGGGRGMGALERFRRAQD